MIFQFPYQPVPVRGAPPPTLPSTATVRWRPLIDIRIVNPLSGQFRDLDLALVDSGADDTVFSLTLATALGIALLPQQGSGHAIRWGGTSHAVRYGEVTLELTDGVSRWSWLTVVAFIQAAIRHSLLGVAGFLQFLNATFLTEDRLLILEPNRAFPGTIT